MDHRRSDRPVLLAALSFISGIAFGARNRLISFTRPPPSSDWSVFEDETAELELDEESWIMIDYRWPKGKLLNQPEIELNGIKMDSEIICRILRFLDLRDIGRLSVASSSWSGIWSYAWGDQEFKRIRVHYGLNSKVRFRAWADILASESETRGVGFAGASLIEQLNDDTIAKEISIHYGAILNDILRTFPNDDTFDVLRQDLAIVLNGISILDPVVGYVQGMNYIVGTILKVEPDPKKALWLFEIISKQYALRRIFEPGLYELSSSLEKFDRILGSNMEGFKDLFGLYIHFQKLAIKPESYALEWFMTLYSYSLPHIYVIRIWDYFVVDGWSIIYKIAISLLREFNEDLIKLDFEEATRFLKTIGKQIEMRWKDEQAWCEFLLTAQQVKISPFLLDN